MSDPLTEYQAMTSKQRHQVLLAEYRCREKGCLLLHVWSTPNGRYWYSPPYRLSPMAANTLGVGAGSRDEPARAGLLDVELAFYRKIGVFHGPYGPDFGCSHRVGGITLWRLAADITGTQPGCPVKLFIGASNDRSKDGM